MSQEFFKHLDTPVQYIKGVGPYLASLLQKMGIRTLEDLLYHIPHRYLDRQKVFSIKDVILGEPCVLQGEIVAFGETKLGRRQRKIFQAIFSDGTGHINAKWFNYYTSSMSKNFRKGRKALLAGTVDLYHGEKQMVHPELEWIEEELDSEEWATSGQGIVPIYPLTDGLHQKTLHKILQNSLEKIQPYLIDSLPQSLIQKYQLMEYPRALRELHQPLPGTDLTLLNGGQSPAHQRLIFDEFFFLELGLALKKQGVLEEEGIVIKAPPSVLEQFYQMLPFSLTAAQERVVGEITADLSRARPMHRLLQGDVGSGKTAVAAAAAIFTIAGGYQACLMAPTEILAEQHARNLTPLLKPFGIETALLKSDIPIPERRERLQKISKGEIHFVVGTHALIQTEVEFQALALAIIDEQHRFGVLQRAEIKKKGKNPHLLVMTATPIPRTLAMTVYGDLEMSVLDELPAGRKPIVTKIFSEKDLEKIYRFIRQEILKGRQAYFVYPLVETSEALDLKNATKMYEHLYKEIFPDLSVGLLHGQMKGEEKERVIRNFLNNKLQILVATTVVEVGIDVPNATLMIIEHAERFGLAQLHQIRGRVGRGGEKSYCFLIAGWPRSELAQERLKIMCETQDGFKISEADLNLRGPGDFLGTRQAGLPDFRIAQLVRDVSILEKARKEAFAWASEDPQLLRPESRLVQVMLKHRWKGRLNLAQVG